MPVKISFFRELLGRSSVGNKYSMRYLICDILLHHIAVASLEHRLDGNSSTDVYSVFRFSIKTLLLYVILAIVAA